MNTTPNQGGIENSDDHDKKVGTAALLAALDPAAISSAALDAQVELFDALADGTLDPEDKEYALRLINDDPSAKNLWELVQSYRGIDTAPKTETALITRKQLEEGFLKIIRACKQDLPLAAADTSLKNDGASNQLGFWLPQRRYVMDGGVVRYFFKFTQGTNIEEEILNRIKIKIADKVISVQVQQHGDSLVAIFEVPPGFESLLDQAELYHSV